MGVCTDGLIYICCDRHRLVNDKNTVFSLASQYLPRELLQEIKIQVPKKNVIKQHRRRAPAAGAEEEEEA